MPRPKSLVTTLRDLVQKEVRNAIASLLGSSTPKRRRRRGKWRPGKPGRPPKSVTEKAAKKSRRAARRSPK